MSRRFFVSGPLVRGAMRLDGAQAHHLVRVLRIGVGQSVTLFDGGPLEASAEVIAVSGDAVELAVAEPRPGAAEAAVELVLAAAVPKGDRFGWLIEKATELGVSRVVPLLTERSVVEPGAGKLDKLRRTIVEASKQCRRTRLMELSDPVGWPAFVARELHGAAAWVAHPAGVSADATALRQAGRVVAAVGPEGGFTDGELALAVQGGAALVSLGPRVLRIETAALALAALFTTCR